MATGNAKRLTELGLPAPTAKELARQITTGAPYSIPKLLEVGFVPLVAQRLVAAMTAATMTADTRNAMASAGVSPVLVREIGAQVAS